MCYCTPKIKAVQCTKITCKPPVPETKIEGWSAWHPKQGFKIRYTYEGAIAYLTLDDACSLVKELNQDEGTNNRTGWRAVKVTVERVP